MKNLKLLFILFLLILINGCSEEKKIGKLLEKNIDSVEMGNCDIGEYQNYTFAYTYVENSIIINAFDDKNISICKVKVNVK